MREYVLAFSLFDGFGFKSLERIYDEFGCFEEAFNSNNLSRWRNVGLKSKEVIGWFDFKKTLKINSYCEELKNKNIEYVCYWDDNYPQSLKNIYSSPSIIYYRGDLGLIEKNNVAVVGTRKHTEYGRRAVESIVPELVNQGLVITSGLALGIDSIAHRSTLNAGGKTIGVLGGSLDVIYPSVNKSLADEIVTKGGLIISEMKLGVLPMRWHFPARNRIVSGISNGVLVVEAPEKSGALITARFAMEHGKSVMVVPGDIFNKKTEGGNRLISEGALMVNSVKDVIYELGLQYREKANEIKFEAENSLQKRIMEILDKNMVYLDELVVQCDESSSDVISELNMMVLNGWVKEEKGGKWYRCV